MMMVHVHIRTQVIRNATAVACVLVGLTILAGCQSTTVAPTEPAVTPAPLRTAGELPAVEPTVDPMALAPADTTIYAQVDDLITLRTRAEGDPLTAFVLQQLGDIYQSPFWARIRDDQGLTDDTMLDKYFGRSIAGMRGYAGDHRGTVVMTRIEPGDAAKLVQSLGLDPNQPLHRFGRFSMFEAQAESAKPMRFAFSQRLMCIAEAKHGDYLDKVLDHAARVLDPVGDAPPTLVDEGLRQSLFAELPTERQAILYARNRDQTEHHAVAIVRGERDVTVHYIASLSKLDELAQDFIVGEGVDFGLLPETTISAASVNLMKRTPQQMQLIDFLLFPRTVRQHLLPNLSTPVLVFLGKIPGDQVTPNPGFDVPAIGVAIRMKDPVVTRDLDHIVSGLRFLANLSEFDLAGTFFESAKLIDEPTPFHVADFGQALIKQVKDPNIKRLAELPNNAGMTRLSFGRIGDWYVVTSQEAFFRQCVAAHNDPAHRLTHTDAFKTFEFKPRAGLIASGISRARPLSELLESVAGYWREKGVDPNDPKAEKRVEEVDRPLRQIADSIESTHSFGAQLWRDDAGRLRATLRFVEAGQSEGDDAKSRGDDPSP